MWKYYVWQICGEIVGTGGKFSASADCPDFDGGMMGNNPI